MSRVEKNIERRYKKRRKRFIFKLVFIFTMIILTSVCLIIVYDNANMMLGNDTFKEESTILLEKLNTYIRSQITTFK